MFAGEKLDRAIFYIQGKDSSKFLQGIVTNDLNLAERGIYCFFLNSLGKYLFDFFIVKFQDGYLLDAAIENKAALMSRFNMYKMRSDVIIEDMTNQYQLVYSHNANDHSVISYQDPRYEKLGYRILLEYDSEVQHIPNLYLDDKYNYAIVDGYIDMKPEKSFPLEYGGEELNAISYSKGCYLGQEVISRTKYQGVIRKFIAKLELQEEGALNSGDEIVTENGDKLGIICSSYKDKAIALIRKEEYDKYYNVPLLVVGGIIIKSLSKAVWYKVN